MDLSKEQRIAVNSQGNVYVTACPGSGKTRALTAKLLLEMKGITCRNKKALAVTFTNRAADEIKSRVQQNEHYDNKKLWTGTIHSFALEWILRPYAGYLDQLNNGFVIADEYECKKILSTIKKDEGMRYFDDVNTTFDRLGNVKNSDRKAQQVERKYRKVLADNKKIDFDQALYFAFVLLDTVSEIATTLGAIFSLICIDEIQDTQDLQYAILSKVYNHSKVKPNLFFVGDNNQAIYESIGGVSMSLEALNLEFHQAKLVHCSFSDNYRSTQRIADYFSYFRDTPKIISKAPYADEDGKILFYNQSIDKQQLPEAIAEILQHEINNNVAENQICIIAPQWSAIRSLSKRLVNILPDVKFDAPSLTPFHGQQDNFWLVISKLALTIPSGRLLTTRIRWANEALDYLNENHPVASTLTAKEFLMIINSFKTKTKVGTSYLNECFLYLLNKLNIHLKCDAELLDSFTLFFEKSFSNMDVNEGEYEDDIDVFRGFFKESSGVVINTCHGVKGEEYETVIAFGMLKGYIPHWGDIINKPPYVANNSESKMMYVISSRAKKNIYLISESGRQTQSRNPLQTSDLLRSYNYRYS